MWCGYLFVLEDGYSQAGEKEFCLYILKFLVLSM